MAVGAEDEANGVATDQRRRFDGGRRMHSDGALIIRQFAAAGTLAKGPQFRCRHPGDSAVLPFDLERFALTYFDA